MLCFVVVVFFPLKKRENKEAKDDDGISRHCGVSVKPCEYFCVYANKLCVEIKDARVRAAGDGKKSSV